jgi:hypothetical protein
MFKCHCDGEARSNPPQAGRLQRFARCDISSGKGAHMPKVMINIPAPDFTLNDFNGNPVRLASFKDKKIVLLVFNRGFV